MANARSLYRRLQAMNTDQLIQDSFQQNLEHLVEENKKQLYAGKNKLGADIAPLYIDDPYFKTRAAAQRYSDWKDRITPNPQRTKGVPNLFIRGDYYDTIRASLAGQALVFTSAFYAAGDINTKFKDIYGLGGSYRNVFIDIWLRPTFRKGVGKATGL